MSGCREEETGLRIRDSTSRRGCFLQPAFLQLLLDEAERTRVIEPEIMRQKRGPGAPETEP